MANLSSEEGGEGGRDEVAVASNLELSPSVRRSEAAFVHRFCHRFERSENETQEMRAAAAAPSRIAEILLRSTSVLH